MIKKFRVKVGGVNKSTSFCLFWNVMVYRLCKRASIRSYSHIIHKEKYNKMQQCIKIYYSIFI